jgi:hypothetical protein
MTKIKMKTVAGKDKGSVDLPASIFGVEPNVARDAPVVTAQLAVCAPGPRKHRPGPRCGAVVRTLAPEGHRPGPPGVRSGAPQ